MLVIRLKRIGKKNKAYYRIVVAEKARAVSGKFVETLGSWDPHQKVKKVKKDRILYWLNIGAKPSDTVYNLLVDEKIIESNKRKVMIKKSKKKEEEGGGEAGEGEAKEKQKEGETVEPKQEEAKEEAKKEEEPKQEKENK